MGKVTGNPLEQAAAQAGRIAAHGKGNWRKMVAFGAAAAIVFVGAAIGYASLKKVKQRAERRKGEESDEGQPAEE